MNHRLIITGANGQLGNEFRTLSEEYSDFSYKFASRSELDICNLKNVRNTFESFEPTIVINCAAYTAVDKAEEDREMAFLVNEKAVGNLATVSRERGAKFVHFSTDYVYHNQNQEIISAEGDVCDPNGVYAESKLKGETLATKIYPKNTYIFRTSWVYSSFGNNFVKTMIRLGQERNEIKIVNDQIGSPTYARDIAKMVLDSISNKKLIPENAGIYNYSNDGCISWFDFANQIFKLTGIEIKTDPIPTKEYPTPAKRPLNSKMSLEKVQNKLGTQINNWKDSLRHCIAELKN